MTEPEESGGGKEICGTVMDTVNIYVHEVECEFTTCHHSADIF